MSANDIREQLVTSGIVSATDIRGCTQREIEDLESQVGASLPIAYKQFLLAIGHQAGAFLRGTDVFYDQIAALTDEARVLLAENGLQDALPEDAFVFYMHQGYEFGYFRISEGADPPVYQYVEGSGPPKSAWPSFTACLDDMIRIHMQALQRHSIN